MTVTTFRICLSFRTEGRFLLSRIFCAERSFLLPQNPLVENSHEQQKKLSFHTKIWPGREQPLLQLTKRSHPV